VVHIDQDKCNGCGLCVPSCAEGALQVLDGKAQLVSDTYCDGLGACLGECPEGAITIEEREAEEFDVGAVEQRLTALGRELSEAVHIHAHVADKPRAAAGGCPGSATRSLQPECAGPAGCESDVAAPAPSQLTNWPIQLTLLPVSAPYLEGARLLIAADCAPFAFADFHKEFLRGRVAVIGCPKLDDAPAYVDKLTEIFRRNHIASVDVVHMEVPCCFGLERVVGEAVANSGATVPASVTVLGLGGEVLETRPLQ
jgi:NAD-dependent dihydropyrimidine dehydrogenase PreA subunit